MNRILDRMVAGIVTMTKITYPRRIERKLVEPESFREALISIVVHNNYYYTKGYTPVAENLLRPHRTDVLWRACTRAERGRFLLWSLEAPHQRADENFQGSELGSDMDSILRHMTGSYSGFLNISSASLSHLLNRQMRTIL